MLTSSPCAEEVQIAGVSAALRLRHDHNLSQRLLAQWGGLDDSRRTVLPCGVSWREADEVIQVCLDLTVAAMQGRPLGEPPAQLSARIGDWAAEGVPLESVQQATHTGFRFVLNQLTRRATSADGRAVTMAGQRVGEVLEQVTTSFTSAYLRYVRAETSGRTDDSEALSSALIAGSATPAWARGRGFEIGEAYAVLALAAASEHPHDPALSKIEARGWLRRLREELASCAGISPLAQLSEGGGTVLIPDDSDDGTAAENLFDRLQAAAATPLRAALVHAPTRHIPGAAKEAHELLDLAERLHRPAGRLYRMRDLVVEYQITRPGPGRQRLAAILAPLHDQPDLVETLTEYLRYSRNRRHAAKTLHIHPNTLDYRLQRVAQITGMDPTHVDGSWYLQSALVAHVHESGSGNPHHL
ncbi:CdaR family transcriptional regulator [Nocardia sp. XZ_19_231]|uniref:PucR family transcriptional regulator n=1 Tax=Nocardia sp. XZ_19_231 TaxID=2769252 RepID=UPI00188FE201|nr:helix-turn-helix domain-containing protein [Nocardia sp. XZ_19_231]